MEESAEQAHHQDEMFQMYQTLIEAFVSTGDINTGTTFTPNSASCGWLLKQQSCSSPPPRLTTQRRQTLSAPLLWPTWPTNSQRSAPVILLLDPGPTWELPQFHSSWPLTSFSQQQQLTGAPLQVPSQPTRAPASVLNHSHEFWVRTNPQFLWVSLCIPNITFWCHEWRSCQALKTWAQETQMTNWLVWLAYVWFLHNHILETTWLTPSSTAL